MDTITLWFVHDHDCKHKGEEVRILPRSSNGAYYAERLVCIETGTELTKSREEKS